jgi:hypothetical protein
MLKSFCLPCRFPDSKPQVIGGPNRRHRESTADSAYRRKEDFRLKPAIRHSIPFRVP